MACASNVKIFKKIFGVGVVAQQNKLPHATVASQMGTNSSLSCSISNLALG